MPEDAQIYDVVVVGGGPTGEHAVGRLRRHGLSAALVEQELVGGECSYWACMPSKMLLRPGAVYAEAQDVPGAREAVTGPIDQLAALERRDWITANWDDAGQVTWLRDAGATLYRGHGQLAGERLVEVRTEEGTVTLEARRAVILATGSQSVEPPIEGLASARHWDNRGATAAKAIPRRFLVLGGGVVGVELAQAFRRLGSDEVTVIEGGEHLIANTEPFAGELVRNALEADGIVVATGARAVRVQRESDDGPITITTEDGQRFEGDELLVAVGRRPNSNGLGLERFGHEGHGPVTVDNAMHVDGVAGEWLFAIGDLNGRAPLTHMGKYQARVAVDAIVGQALATLGPVTGTIFTDPQVAFVGMTESAARGDGLDVRVVKTALEATAAAEIAGVDVRGICQLVVDSSRSVIVGATFVGRGIDEALHAATVAVVGEVPIERLRHAVPSFPTLSEVWLDLLDQAIPL